MLEEPILNHLREAAAVHFSPFKVLAAYVHGSRVAGRALPSSDLDVGYYLEGYREGAALSLGDEMRLAAALTRVSGVGVDLRNLANAPLDVRGRVLEDGIRIFSGDDVQRVALERDLLARYHDYKDIFRQMHELRLRSLAAKAAAGHGR